MFIFIVLFESEYEPDMPRPERYPLPLRVLRSLFPTLERLFPWLGKRMARSFFMHPRKFPLPPIELEWLAKSVSSSLQFHDQVLAINEWGDPTSKNKLLLVHGWAGRPTQFWRIIEELVSKQFHIISFDGPAHGASTGSKTDLIQFSEIIRTMHQKYQFKYLSGHSFGGAACVLAFRDGLSGVQKLVLISAPSSGDGMMSDFIRNMNGTPKTEQYLQKVIKKEFGYPLSDFFANKILPLPNFPQTLAVHDDNDWDVDFEHLDYFEKNLLGIQVIKTTNLGHTKIMRDQEVVNRISDFLRDGQ